MTRSAVLLMLADRLDATEIGESVGGRRYLTVEALRALARIETDEESKSAINAVVDELLAKPRRRFCKNFQTVIYAEGLRLRATP